MADTLNILFRSLVAYVCFALVALVGFSFSQTAPNTQITNQAKAVYKYKTFPTDTIHSNQVLFRVKEAPNFSISFGARDTNVFGKETVFVRLVYTNIGNANADTATIEGILPPAGLRFVPGSTSGTISGSTVTWKIFNVQAGKSDSVGVKIVVDSTLLAGTNLQMEGTIGWQSSLLSVTKTFVVGNFPRLEISNISSASFVGAGRTLTYQITVSNRGNIASLNTSVIDSISSLGSFVQASITPDSLSPDAKIVKWNLGTINAFSTKTISIVVSTAPNLGFNQLRNSAFVSASNVGNSASSVIFVQIVPIAPQSITMTVNPKFIFGQQNRDSSRIEVVLKDSLNQLLPEGVPVQFTTSRGTFPNNANTYLTTLQNGFAVVYVRSEDVQNTIQSFTVTAVGGSILSGTVASSSELFLYPGAVTGKVINGLDQLPYQGAIATVFNQASQLVGTDTTKNDGKFFIALNKDVTKYLLKIFVVDKFGDTVVTQAPIDPSKFPLPPLVIPNSLFGRILYRQSGQPVPAESITVFLDSAQSAGSALTRRGKSVLPGSLGTLTRVQQQKTDFHGRFKFENLKPAVYVVSVDSNQFPSLKGASVISDTVSGSFTINLSIEIEQDSSVTLGMNSPAKANAGDTLHYSLSAINSGNYLHKSVTLIDTLPIFSRFVSAQRGGFDSFAFDSTAKILTWSRDSLAPTADDSVSFAVLLTRNIPDSTKIRNSAWFSSNLNLTVNKVGFTTVRSAAIPMFGMFYTGNDSSVVAGDSVKKKIWYGNTGTDSLRGIKIIDSVYFGGKSRLTFKKAKIDSVALQADSIATIYIGAIPPGAYDTLTIGFSTDYSLSKGTKIISRAYLLKNDSVIASDEKSLTMSDNPNLSSYLKIVKTGNKKVAEIGDIITYQIQISNTSPDSVYSIGVYDLLPHAFKYIKKSGRYNGEAYEPTINANLNLLTWSIPKTILSSKTGILVYQLAIGADAMESQGLNTATASVLTRGGTQLVSASSQWQVTVRPGVFTEKGLIIGKVFYDDNRNTFQESGETGIKSVELWMEDGTRIITGDDGKFSLPEVKPGQHVLRVNERTLPPSTELLGGLTSFAKDPTSRFVNVTESGIAKANFFVRRNLRDSLTQSIGKVNKLTAVRQAKPKYLYHDDIRNISRDTVDMYVSLSFNGNKYLQSIEINESLAGEFSIVPNSATFNGRKVIPVLLGTTVNWKLGRAKQSMQGILHYKVALKRFSKKGSVLYTVSSVKVMTADSMEIESNNVITENIVNDVVKNSIETSDVQLKNSNPDIATQLGDSVSLSSGEEVFFKTSIFIDPKKKVKAVQLIDSLESQFLLNERSFTINGAPIPYRNVTVKVKSSALTARGYLEKNEIEFLRIASVTLTDLVRSGLNEITYTAKLQSAPKDTFYSKVTHAVIKNEFGEESFIRSSGTKIFIKSTVKPEAVSLETSYVEIPRSAVKPEEKIADAIKLIESLKDKNAKTAVIEGITFEYGKTVLTMESKVLLDNIAATLQQNLEMNLRINGYTDNTGNAAVNRKVSLDRAKAVRDYLIVKGINGKRLSAQGFGSDKPITTNKTEEGRNKNRRIEFERVK